MLMQLTRHELASHAEFQGDSAFLLNSCPFAGDIPLGQYELPRRSGEAHLYRPNHSLALAILERAKSRELPVAEVLFQYDDHLGKVSVLEPFRGQAGWLTLSRFTVESLDQAEDHLIFAVVTDDGATVDGEAAARLFTLPAQVSGNQLLLADESARSQLDELTAQRTTSIRRTVSERNRCFFETEADKLEGWAEDLKLGLEREIKEMDRQIKEARRAGTTALTLEEKLAGQKQIKTLEAQRSQKRRVLFDAQDEVDQRRTRFIEEIEKKLGQKTGLNRLFLLRWSLS
jgi:adenine-specific DNA-methyltransferase